MRIALIARTLTRFVPGPTCNRQSQSSYLSRISLPDCQIAEVAAIADELTRLIAYRDIVSDILTIDRHITTGACRAASGLSWVIHGASNSCPIFGRGRTIPLFTCYARIRHSRGSRLVTSTAVAGGICNYGPPIVSHSEASSQLHRRGVRS
jgi:hypothetical protein